MSPSDSESESESSPRKLVSLRNISQIKPLSSSNTREVVMVGGWPVVVPKGEFAVDQLILYFEIDSFLPFESLLPTAHKLFEPYLSSYVSAELHGKKGWVVQTVMIDGHVSQGMVLCIDDLEEVRGRRLDMEDDTGSDFSDPSATVDAMMMDVDFTNTFEVQRWTTFYRLDGGRDVGRPPYFLPDTKLKRAQNLPNLWKTHGNREFEITEMLDGIPVTVYKVHQLGEEYLELPGTLMSDIDLRFFKRSGMGISVGDHDYEETEESSSWAALRGQGILDELADLPSYEQTALAGVLCGVGIAGNPLEIKGRRFFVHSISDPHTMERFNMKKAAEWQGKLHDTFQLVPTISRRVTLSAFAENIDKLMSMAAGKSFLGDSPYMLGPQRKGLVFRALDGSLNFKAISNEWLLDETTKFQELGEEARRRPGPKDCVN